MAYNPTGLSEKKSPSSSLRGWIITFSILLALCLFLTLISISLNQTLFTSDFYTQFLEQQGFYADLPGIISDAVISNSQALTNSPLSWLSREQMEIFLKSVLPPDWLKEQTGLILQSVMSFINLKQDDLFVTIDMQVVKNSIRGPQGKGAILSLIKALPDCTVEQLYSIITAVQTWQNGFELCNPALIELSLLEQIIDPVLTEMADVIPAVVVIPTGAQAQLVQDLIKTPGFQGYRVARKGLGYLSWVSIFLFILIIVLSWRYFRLMMTGLSLALVMAGVAGVIPGAWFFLGSKPLATVWLNSAGFSTLSSLNNLLITMVQQLSHSAGRLLLIYSLSSLMVGLIFLALTPATRR